MPSDMPEWASGSPVLGQLWVEIDQFLIRVEALGADKDKAKTKVMELMQDYPSMTWDNARAYVLYEIANGRF